MAATSSCVRPSTEIGITPLAKDLGVEQLALSGRNGEAAEDAVETAVPRDRGGAEAGREHIVLLGETLNTIADLYGTDSESLELLNRIEDSALLLPGRVLIIPSEKQSGSTPYTADHSTDFEIISNQQLVYGPGAKAFNLEQFLAAYDGALLSYSEEVEGETLDGPAIVQLVADRTSVNPRLLLALLEYNAGWLTGAAGQDDFVLGREEEGYEGLYKQLSWAANMLNWGFYGRSDGGMTKFLVGETEMTYSPEISDGSAGVQNYLGARSAANVDEWLIDIGPDGLAATYRQLFGEPENADLQPLLPASLEQPSLALPWASGETWYFTGGPHGGWNSGSAWAALDFVPSEIEYGCTQSDSWVTAVADGVVTRSGKGAVVLDLDGDGYAGTGWAITYMHLENRGRVAQGTQLSAGDRIGHPGCEGGFSNGTHLHLARTFNGRWISADGDIPFNLAGWISGGLGYEYNGWLERDGVKRTADVYHTEDNAITAD